MSNVCSKCTKKLSLMDNHGTDNMPLCYECANQKVACDKCKKEIIYRDIVLVDNKFVCKNCMQKREEEKKALDINEDNNKKHIKNNIENQKPQEVVIKEIKIPFGSMVSLLIKVAFASIPALIVVTITITVVMFLLISISV